LIFDILKKDTILNENAFIFANKINIMNTLETKRLILRPHIEADAADFVALNCDDNVVRYTGDAAIHTEAEALHIFRNIIFPQYAKYDMGRLAVILKETGEYIGWCGLKFLAEDNEVDIGYRFMQKHWGKGYASEAAASCIKEGFEHYQLSKIIGMVVPENIGSVKVLEKIGLRFVKEEIGFEDITLLWQYAVLKEEYFLTFAETVWH
jgi:[ribosomal protein S5]-alanine N-acetyltransferase